MKINFYDHVQGLTLDLSTKIEGIAYLIRNLRPIDYGHRDREAQEGIALILEDLAKEGRRIYRMLDAVERPSLEEKIEINHKE